METGGPTVLVGGALYDVSDPVHPRLLCTVSNTVAHLFSTDTFEYLRRTSPSGTEVVLRSIGSGNQSVVAGWPLNLLDDPAPHAGAWTPDGNSAATMANAIDASGNPTIQVWLFAEPSNTELYNFPTPLTDCICRFGIPPPTLAFSADGQYLVSGWPVGKGAQNMRVYRVADASLMVNLDLTASGALWSRTGHTLILNNSFSWSPEDGYRPLDGSVIWKHEFGLSPDGTKVAYTSFVPTPLNELNDFRVYVYDINAHKTTMLSNQLRTEVTFVKDGWVWYLEEAACASCLGGTGPTGRVFAMNLANGVEVPVVFAAGESPTALQSGWGPGQFWPNS